MSVLAIRDETGTRRRFERRGDSRVEQLRERIARDEYAVDPAQVAEAIVRRLRFETARQT